MAKLVKNEHLDTVVMCDIITKTTMIL